MKKGGKIIDVEATLVTSGEKSDLTVDRKTNELGLTESEEKALAGTVTKIRFYSQEAFIQIANVKMGMYMLNASQVNRIAEIDRDTAEKIMGEIIRFKEFCERR